jgi:hypothetical protein
MEDIRKGVCSRLVVVLGLMVFLCWTRSMRALIPVLGLFVLGCGSTTNGQSCEGVPPGQLCCPQSVSPGAACNAGDHSCALSIEVICSCGADLKWACSGGPPDLGVPDLTCGLACRDLAIAHD